MFFTIFSAKKFRWLGQIFCRIWQTGQHSNLLVILLASQVLNAQVTFWSEEQKMSKRSIILFFKIKKPSVQRNVHNFENNFTLVEVLKEFRSFYLFQRRHSLLLIIDYKLTLKGSYLLDIPYLERYRSKLVHFLYTITYKELSKWL